MEKKIAKASRARSPNYPNYDLRQCVAFIGKLYLKFGTNTVHVEDAITQMGHSPTSSTANRVLASLLCFGLIETHGAMGNKYVQITKLGQGIILEKEETPRRLELLQQSAINDSSMQEVWEKWGANIPDEETIKKELQLNMKYSPDGAKRFSSVIVETYNFSQLYRAVTDSNEKEQDLKDEKYEEKGGDNLSLRKANLLLRGQNREVVIYAPSDLTDEEFDRILQWLKFQKDGFVNSDSYTMTIQTQKRE